MDLESNPKASWDAEIRRVAAARRWPTAIVAVGWLHQAFFVACQACDWLLPRPLPNWPYPVLWLAEVLAVCAVVTGICGRRWADGSPVGRVVVRIWGTFLILAFGLSTLNALSGLDHVWFRPVWCTLGTFGFATMAWLFHLGFLVPAFQMYFTSLLMVKFPEYTYLIHGLSWCLAMNGTGLVLRRRLGRRALERPSVRVPTPPVVPATRVPLPLGPLALAPGPPGMGAPCARL